MDTCDTFISQEHLVPVRSEVRIRTRFYIHVPSATSHSYQVRVVMKTVLSWSWPVMFLTCHSVLEPSSRQRQSQRLIKINPNPSQHGRCARESLKRFIPSRTIAQPTRDPLIRMPFPDDWKPFDFGSVFFDAKVLPKTIKEIWLL